jgi:hypothetical protein
MHPLVFWSISQDALARRAEEDALRRAQRDSGIEQPAPLTRDERWVAAIHRWAAAEPQQSAPSARPANDSGRLRGRAV